MFIQTAAQQLQQQNPQLQVVNQKRGGHPFVVAFYREFHCFGVLCLPLSLLGFCFCISDSVPKTFTPWQMPQSATYVLLLTHN